MDDLINFFNNCNKSIKAIFIDYLIKMGHETGNEFYFNLLDKLAEQSDAEYFQTLDFDNDFFVLKI
jgi:hypothetical protein